jgi:hypothetical protein
MVDPLTVGMRSPLMQDMVTPLEKLKYKRAMGFDRYRR